jgi:hypothetical protein
MDEEHWEDECLRIQAQDDAANAAVVNVVMNPSRLPRSSAADLQLFLDDNYAPANFAGAGNTYSPMQEPEPVIFAENNSIIDAVLSEAFREEARQGEEYPSYDTMSNDTMSSLEPEDLGDLLNITNISGESFNGDNAHHIDRPQHQTSLPVLSSFADICLSYKEESVAPVEDAISDVCPICGNAANKHKYYGGRVCHSCRAFFRRYVILEYKNTVNNKCTRGGRCIIIAKSKRSCRSCRFNKCLKAGMKPQWVLSESKGACATTAVLMPRSLEDKFTEVECKMIQGIFMSLTQYTVQQYVDHHILVGQGASFMDFMDGVTSKRTFGFSSILSIRKLGSMGLTGYMRCLMDSNSISIIDGSIKEECIVSNIGGDILDQDKKTLLEQNVPLLHVYNILAYLGRQNKYMEEFMARLLKIIKSNHHADLEIAKVKTEIEKRPVSRDNYLTYNHFFKSPWATEERLETRHRELTDKINAWNTETINENDAQDTMVVHCLMMLIIFFSTDFVDGLIDPKPIQRQQYKFCTLLHKYLKSRSSKSSRSFSNFGHAIMICAYTREMRELENMRLPV